MWTYSDWQHEVEAKSLLSFLPPCSLPPLSLSKNSVFCMFCLNVMTSTNDDNDTNFWAVSPEQQSWCSTRLNTKYVVNAVSSCGKNEKRWPWETSSNPAYFCTSVHLASHTYATCIKPACLFQKNKTNCWTQSFYPKWARCCRKICKIWGLSWV